jgi:uncharacterized membrane protein YccF (DUF307 family)
VRLSVTPRMGRLQARADTLLVNLLYVPLIGFPVCVLMFAIGLALSATIIGLPVGLTVMALGVKMLTLKR